MRQVSQSSIAAKKKRIDSGRAQHRGQDQLAYALEDVLRGVSLGLRGMLVADMGLLWVLRDLKRSGELPEDLVVRSP